MDFKLIGVIVALFFLYMYLYQRKYAETYMSYSSESETEEGFAGCGYARKQ